MKALLPSALALSVALSAFAIVPAPAQAASTGWVTPQKFNDLSKEMARRGFIPNRMECRGDSRSTFVRDSMEIRVTYGPNRSKTRWQWTWGANFGAFQKKMQKDGFKQVSASSFTRPNTGLVVRCGIFHK